jgi:hypothetical protein
VQPEEVSFLWKPYLPLRKVTLLDGDPDIGKTFLALAIAAAITRGWPLPGEDGVPRGTREPANVLYMTAEDGLADTLRPRLDAMGGDPSRFHVADGWRSEDGQTGDLITLKDLDVLEDALLRVKPSLFALDPLFAYLGTNVDAYRPNETRPIMTRLMRLAEFFDCAVIAIRHLRKAEAVKAIYRGLGSIDFTAAVRSILFVGEDPEQKGRRVMAHAKSNLAAKGASLAYEVTPEGCFRWAGLSGLSAEDLASPQAEDPRPQRAKATDFLRSTLAEGRVRQPHVEELAKEAGISTTTLKRAKSDLGVISEHVGDKGQSGGGEWYWRLPDGFPEARGPEAHPSDSDTLALPVSPGEARSESEGEPPKGGGRGER